MQPDHIIRVFLELYNMFCNLHDKIYLEEADVDSDNAVDFDIAICAVSENAAKTKRDAIKLFISII